MPPLFCLNEVNNPFRHTFHRKTFLFKEKLVGYSFFSFIFCTFAPKRENQNYGRNCNKKKAYSRGSPCVARCSRQRKEAFQKETNEWWQARQRGLKEAAESGY